MKQDATYIRWFADIRNEDVGLVGGKNASLGEMYSELTPKGVKIPDGFAVTAEGYWHVLDSAGILDDLKETLAGLDRSDVADLAKRGKQARDLILSAGIPDDLWSELKAAYDMLCDEYGSNADVAVRSSATAEDLPTASFAGQQETYLNVRGYQALREAYIKCLASLFTDRAIAYRIDNHFDHFRVALSVGVMKMVRSDLAASGVIFTLDTDTGFRDVVLITGSYGLGEMIVQGAVNPDEFYVFKPTFRKGYRAIVRKNLGGKRVKLIYGLGGAKEVTRRVDVPEADQKRFCIADDDVLTLAGYALTIEDHYSESRCRWTSSGQRTARPGRSSSSRPGPKRCSRRRRETSSRPTTWMNAGRCLPPERASGMRSLPGRPGSSPTSAVSPSSGRERSWSPTPPRRTGSL